MRRELSSEASENVTSMTRKTKESYINGEERHSQVSDRVLLGLEAYPMSIETQESHKESMRNLDEAQDFLLILGFADGRAEFSRAIGILLWEL